jgi:hypothetical protein
MPGTRRVEGSVGAKSIEEICGYEYDWPGCDADVAAVRVMTRAARPRKRQRGSIDTLPGGALRVRVFAGLDPLTKRRHDLIEIIPPGPDAAPESREGPYPAVE